MNSINLEKQYGNMVWDIIHKLNIPYDLQLDAYHEGFIAMCDALNTFKDTRSKLQTWIYYKSRMHILRWWIKQKNPYGKSASFYQNHSTYTISLDEDDRYDHFYTDSSTQTFEDTSDTIDDVTIIKEFCELIDRRYNKTECDVIRDYYIYNASYNSLLKKYGNVARILRKTDVDNIILKLRKRYTDWTQDSSSSSSSSSINSIKFIKC